MLVPNRPTQPRRPAEINRPDDATSDLPGMLEEYIAREKLTRDEVSFVWGLLRRIKPALFLAKSDKLRAAITGYMEKHGIPAEAYGSILDILHLVQDWPEPGQSSAQEIKRYSQRLEVAVQHLRLVYIIEGNCHIDSRPAATGENEKRRA